MLYIHFMPSSEVQWNYGIMPVSNLEVVIKSMVLRLYIKVNTPYSR